MTSLLGMIGTKSLHSFEKPPAGSLLKFCYPSNSSITHFLSVLPFLVISNINIHHGMTSPLCMMETKSLHFFVKPPEKFYFPSN